MANSSSATSWESIGGFLSQAGEWFMSAGAVLARGFGSDAAIAAISSIAGAALGAYSAYRLAENGKLREELLKEIRNVNAAIGLSAAILNSAMQFKTQHVLKLWTDYDEMRSAAEKHRADVMTGLVSADVALHMEANLGYLAPLSLPIEKIQNHLFEKLTVVGRPLVAAISLGEVAARLIHVTNIRNELVKEFKASGGIRNPEFLNLYFGFVYDNGSVNEEYSGAMESISTYTDNLIFFSNLLSSELSDHGEKLAAQFKKNFPRLEPPLVHRVQPLSEETAQLLPDAKHYESWLSGFVKGDGEKLPIEKAA